MTRDGVVLENQTTGEEINISDREAEQDFTPAGATGRAEKVLERADQVRERRSMKKAAKQAGQVEADTGPRPSARLQFSEEERSTPELKKYIRKSDRRADRLDAARAAIPKETVKIKEYCRGGHSKITGGECERPSCISTAKRSMTQAEGRRSRVCWKSCQQKQPLSQQFTTSKATVAARPPAWILRPCVKTIYNAHIPG